MYLEQSQSIQHIKNINNKTAANQDYANKINRMEKVVKIFGRLTQKQKRLIKTPIIKEASRINLLVSSNSMSPASMNRGLSEKSMSFVAESPLTSSSRRKSIQGNILFFADSVDDEDDNTLIRCDSVTDMIVGNESRTTVPSFTRSQSLAVTSSGAVLNNDRKNAAASSAGKGKETSLTSASKSMLGSRSKSTSTPTGASHRRGSSDASDISAKSKTGSTPKAAPMSQAEILSSIKPSSAGKALLNDVDDSTHGDSSAVSEVKPSTGEKGLSKKASEFDFFAIYTTPSQRQPAVDSNSTSSYSMEINQSLEEPLPAAPTDAMHALTNLSKQTYGSDSSQAPTPRAQTALLSPKINNTLSANRRGSAVLQQALNDPSTSLNPNSPTKRRQSIDDSPSASHKMFSPELAKVESVPTLEIAKTDTILSTEIKPSMAKPSSTEIGQNYHPVDSSTTTSVIPPFKEEEKLAVKPNLKVDTSRHTDAVRKPLAVDSRVNSQTQDIMKVIKDLKHASPVSNSRSNSVEKKHEFGKPVLRHVEPGMKSIEARKEKEVTEIKPREVRPVKDSVSTEKTEKSAPLTPTKAKKPDEVSPFKRVTLRPASLPRKGSIERIEFPEHLAPVPVLLDEDDAGSAATQKHLSEKRKNTVKAYVKQKNMEIEFKRTTSLVDMKPRSNSASPERGRLPAISGNSSTNNSSRASTPDSISAVNITREPFSTGVSPANSVDKRGIAGLDNSGSLSITEANFDEVLSSLDHVSADKSAETCNKNKKATKPTLRRNPDASYSMYTNTTGLSDYDKDVDHPDSKTGNIHIEESLSGVRVELMSTSDDSLSPKRSPSIRPFHVKEKESFLERTLPTVPGENGNDQGKIEAAGRPPLVPSTTVDFKTKNDELKEDNYPAMSTELPTGNASSDVNAREPSISKGFFAIMGNSSDSQVLQDNFKTSGTDDKAEASLNDQVQPEAGILLGNLSSPSVKSDMTMSDAGSRPPTLKKKKSMAKMVRYLILGKNKKKHALDLAEFETVSNADSNHGSTPNVRDSWDSTSQAGAVDGGKDRKSTGELNTSAGSKEKKIPIEGSSLDENSVSGSVISGLPLDQQSVAASSAPGDEGVPKKKKGFFKLVKHSIIGSKKKKYADDNQSIAESATEGQH